MMKTIRWKTSFFANKTKIYQGNECIGTIKTNFFNNKAIATLKDTELRFRRTRLFNEQFKFRQSDNQQDTGVIDGKSFSEKYQIHFTEQQKRVLAPKNFWKTKWMLRGEEVSTIEFKGGLSGTVSYEDNVDEALILAALFCLIQNNWSSIIIAVVIVIIIAS